VRFMLKSPAQSGRLRTLIHPGPVSGVHVISPCLHRAASAAWGIPRRSRHGRPWVVLSAGAAAQQPPGRNPGARGERAQKGMIASSSASMGWAGMAARRRSSSAWSWGRKCRLPGKWLCRSVNQSSRAENDQPEKEGATVCAAKDTGGLAEGVKAAPPSDAQRSGADATSRGACVSLDARSQTAGGRSGAPVCGSNERRGKARP